MIRKPDARELKERVAVSAIRDAGTLAVEGARGAGKGTAKLLQWWLMLMFGFGFVMAVLSHLNAVGALLLLAGGVAWALMSRRRRQEREAAVAARPRTAPRVVDASLAGAEGHYDLSVAAVGQAAAMVAVPAILLFPTSGMFSFMMPLTLVGVAALALAILLVARLWGDRAVVRYDASTLNVRGLLGEGTMLWDDVDDVTVQTVSMLNLTTWFSSGTRRNILVTAARNRLGGPNRLLIPYPLLGLDRDALAQLVTKLLLLQAGAPDLLNSAVATPGNALSARRPDAAEMPFDPDAIMARYMAEREQVIAAARPDLAARGAPRTFGRKRVRN